MPRRFLILFPLFSFLACAESVHPRVGTGIPAPTWIEVEPKIPFEQDDPEAEEPASEDVSTPSEPPAAESPNEDAPAGTPPEPSAPEEEKLL
ncbi:MAG TPA: hypothetical protein PKL73_25085 [Polyangiaceae bacterium]|jgi:hypothetical protein|nr:MAG: hypothetical protein BWY17_00401 [Deltaproteobacteria bacterium ADurb.Bin207]HNT00261.1 hypothetical protein [Polyangiaceae bacterium]HNZ20970.1 hypothetical protein [Polyangiaceae bacterium]HOD23881.1 hypothetical protein [Polyangiaceae bacterium]HOG98840.1 hypothetical protein [Polyangiaceae bacterium]